MGNPQDSPINWILIRKQPHAGLLKHLTTSSLEPWSHRSPALWSGLWPWQELCPRSRSSCWDLCHLHSGEWHDWVRAALCTQDFFFLTVGSKLALPFLRSFALVRVRGKNLLPDLLFPQGLFSEGVFYVLTAHLSAFLYIHGIVRYDLAYNLYNGSKASWIRRGILS